MDMGWVHPWVGLVGSKFWQIIGLGWIGLDRLNHVNFISVIVVAVSVAVWAKMFRAIWSFGDFLQGYCDCDCEIGRFCNCL